MARTWVAMALLYSAVTQASALEPRVVETTVQASTLEPKVVETTVQASTLEPKVVETTVIAPEAEPNAAAVQKDVVPLAAVEVLGRQLDIIGKAVSASEGYVGRDEIAARPRVRSGDLLELVPGMVATQHSGSGKANQYFLRGFNLDHGTDFATFVDGMPVNLRTHGHGQGYSDLNFLIPELVEALSYRKGTYYTDVGDFSAAGSAHFQIADALPAGTAEISAGQYGYGRGLLVDSGQAREIDWLYGLEVQRYQGPWQSIDESVEKVNAVLRAGYELGHGRLHLMAMAYDNAWNAPDQIPSRAVAQGLISPFGSLDLSLGGQSSRRSFSAGWTGEAFGGELSADGYWIDSDFKLWSNFTYTLEHPDTGDQFEQFDSRRIFGGSLKQAWSQERVDWQLGLQYRFDRIDAVGLNRTRERQYLDTVREDAVDEQSLGVFASADLDLSQSWRLSLGARQDWFDFEVDAGNPLNSGSKQDGMASAKLALVYRPRDEFEGYLSAGQGFHSNDARGVTLRVDPVTGEAAESADPLVRSKGAELGARIYLSDRVHASLAYWRLDLDSELLFVGDAGTTEASFPSRREGAELGVYVFPTDRLSAELELGYTDARFRNLDDAEDAIPGAIPWVVSAGVSWRPAAAWSLGARLRHFGRYALIEDRMQNATGSTILNLRTGYDRGQLGIHLEVLNLLDSDAHDIDYYYASRLPGEAPEGIDDRHFHPLEPRALRLSVQWRWP